jgi:hypothetical protein
MTFFKAFLSGARPLLLESGLSIEFVDVLESHERHELEHIQNPCYVRVQQVYARKKHPVEKKEKPTL